MRSHDKIVFIAAGLVVLLWSAFVAQQLHHHRDELAAAKRDIATTAALFEEHARRTFDPASHLLEEMVVRAARSGLNSDDVLEVFRLAAAAPSLAAVMIADANGDILVHSEVERSNLNFRDRDYFQAHLRGVPKVFGKVVKSRVTGRSLFTLSRRLADAQGIFLGIVVLGVDERHFSAFHAQYLGAGGWVALYDASDDLVVATAEGEAQALSQALRPPADLRDTAIVETDTAGDGVIAAFRRVEGTPITIGVFVPRDAVMAEWLSEVGEATARGLVGTILLVILMLRLRRTVARLDAAREAAVQANAAKGRFLAAVGHDLHQPLRAAELFLEHAATARDGDRDRLLADARAAVAMLNEMLTSLVQYALADRGQITPQLEPLPLADVVAPVLASFGEAALQRRVEVVAVPCSAVVQVDPVLLRRCLGNLMANALKHARGRVLVGCRRQGEAVRIEVWDDGPGIPPGRFKAIFQEFHKEGPQDARISAGLGLGLAVVDQVASRLGWEVSVSSRPGKGACFGITVPLADLSCTEDGEEELVPA